MQKTIYIAGPIKGKDFDTVKAEFARIEKLWKDKGYQVINPVELIIGVNERRQDANLEPLNDDELKHRRAILAHTISSMIAQADEVCMMDNWKESFGASLEHDIALQLDMFITYL